MSLVVAGVGAAAAVASSAYGIVSAPSASDAPTPQPPTIVSPPPTQAAVAPTATAPTAPVAPVANSNALSIDQQRQAAAAQALSGRASTIMTQQGQGTNDTLG